jgi:hypothetical protein
MSYEITPYKNLQFSSKVNDQAVLNMMPTWFRESAKKIPKRNMRMDFDNLVKLARPNQTEEMLRLTFWEEYKRAIAANEDTMILSNIFGGVCDPRIFRDLVEKNPIKLAYLLFPTPALSSALEDIIQLGTKRMRTLLNAEPVDEEGKVNVKLASLQKTIWETAIKLKNGTTQNVNINQRSLNVTQIHSSPPPIQDVTPAPAQIESVKPEPLATDIEPSFSMAELEAAALADLPKPSIEVKEPIDGFEDDEDVLG